MLSGAVLLCVLQTLAVASESNEASGAETTNTPSEIRLDDWQSDLPPGVSLIIRGGGLVNNGFPAISADRSRVAVFYYGGHPLVEAIRHWILTRHRRSHCKSVSSLLRSPNLRLNLN